ncbi:MAG: APC family permease [Rhodospirillales bacterium]
MRLQRNIGLIGLTFVAVSGVIGSGWLFAPQLSAGLAGPASLVAWAIGGVAMLLLALTFAEICAMLPVAGGIARVPLFSHGNVVAMAMGWSAWIGYNVAAPIEVEAMLRYLVGEVDWLYVDYATKDLTAAGLAVVAGLLALFTLVNAFGVRLFAYINTSITWVKIAVPVTVTLVILADRFIPANMTQETSGGFMPFGWHGVLAAVSTGGVVFSFVGFRHAIDMAGEAKNPGFTVPAALILAVIVCFLIYAGMQVAFIGALSEADLAQGWGHLSLGHDYGPMAAIASVLGLLWLVSLLQVGAVLGPFGGGLVAVGSNGRLCFALAQNGLFPSLFARLSSFGVPMKALLLNFAVGCLAIVIFDFEGLVALSGAAIVLSFIVGPIAVVVLRDRLPHRKRPFRMPMASVLSPIAFIIATMMVYWSGWDTVWPLGLGLLVGSLLFLARSATGRIDALDATQARWLIPYLGGLAILSYLGDFGGGLGLVPFGWDLLVCTLLGGATFLLAVRSGLEQEAVESYIQGEQQLEERRLD